VEGITTSGRRAELVLGVAGAGKTTALAAARDGFEAAGYRVLGTSTSGQAARTLGRQAGIDPSRTIASLLWRLDHHQLHLGPRTVLVIDEAGMTNDHDLLRHTNQTRTKVILVGDDRQLGPVGPGGAFGALLARAPDAVHVLRDNVRQHDPGERRALDHLRAGNVDLAVAWYDRHGRIELTPTRDEAIGHMAAAWVADTQQGLDSGLYAWRRANVAALNTATRAAWAEAGGLTGPELHTPDGRPFRAGDRILTLAPGHDGQTVTSERGVVEHVQPEWRTMWARMDDGRRQPFRPDDMTSDRLDYGYATTIHRAQGATVDTAHRLHDGGGRQLAYVALSRARHHATVHIAAGSRQDALEELTRDWSLHRAPHWALDRPETHGGVPIRDHAMSRPARAAGDHELGLGR